MKRCPSCGNVCLPAQAFCGACGGSLSAAAQIEGDPYIGSVLAGRYRMVQKLGEGGMGVVYRAEVLDIGRTVAVKLLHERYSADPVAMKRFEREAQVASKLDHPNSIGILDFGHSPSGASYIVMEYLVGDSLSAALARAAFTCGRSVGIVRQLLSVLEAAHAAGIIHRDLKPANIFLLAGTADHVKVLDFGIARLRRDPNERVTRTGMVCGTPEYMSPEQARGFELDARSDLYSAGVLLYEMLTGRRPFEAKTPADVMSAQISVTPIPPSLRAPERHIPPSLDAIVLWALAKAPEDRFPSAVEFRRVMEAWAEVAGASADEADPDRSRCPACEAALAPGARTCGGCGLTLPPPTGSTQAVATADVLASRLRVGTGEVPEATSSAQQSRLSEEERRAEQRAHWFGHPLTLGIPIVGNEALLERLEGLVARPELSLIRFVGPPGAGKRRVANALLGRIASEGRRCIPVQPDPWGHPEPLSAIQQATTRLLDLPCEPMSTDDLRAALGDLPTTRDTLMGLAELYGLGTAAGEPEARRVRRARAWRALVVELSRRRPTTLLFEDFDRMDGATRELVLALAAGESASPVAVVVTHRPEFLALWPPGFHEVPITGLNRSEAQILALEISDGQIDADTAWRAVSASQGNPLHLIQLVAFLRSENRTEPPSRLADLVGARLSGLPFELKALLQQAAVLGETVDPEALAWLAPDGAPVKEMLTALQSRTFLSSTADGIRFLHPYIRQVVYASIPAGIRAEIHGLLAAYHSQHSASPSMLAHHGWNSDHPERSLAALMEAGERALDLLDEESAAEAYRRALRLLPSPGQADGDPGSRSLWVRVVQGLVRSLAQGGDVEAARLLKESAQEKAATAGWHAEAARLETIPLHG